MTELADLGVAELLAKYRSHEASPLEAVQSCLKRIEELDPEINAILTLQAEQCLEGAKASTERWMSGDARLLEGIPFGAKDILLTAGIRTTGGSKIYGDFVPDTTATVVQRLQDEHALLLAKLQTFEFATGDNSHYGPTRNPWNVERTTGGSSVGAAAALAARQLPLAVGTDTGGSIRLPAALCGVSGYKPTQGLVSRHGVMPLSWTLDHVGPLARSVEDLALALSVMAGHDHRDPLSLQIPPGHNYLEKIDDGIDGLRLGVPVNWFFDLIDPQVEEATRQATEVLSNQGMEIIEIELENAHLAVPIVYTVIYAEHASLQEENLDRIDEFGPDVGQKTLAAAQFTSALDYLRALRGRHLVQRGLEAAFEQVDAVIVPAVLAPPPLLEDMMFELGEARYAWGEEAARMTAIFNVAGVPALAIPAGTSDEGLPIGIQIAAPPLRDATCLRIGHAYQKATSYHLDVPPMVPH